MKSQYKVIELELGEKNIIVRPADIYYFTVYDYKQGKEERDIPILIQENIEEKFPIRTYLERKELSMFTKLLARKGFSFDSYESNWKIEKIEQKEDVMTIHCAYIDMFQFRGYEVLKSFLAQIVSSLRI